ncbi:MAG: CBS domain-containing protein, partial [Pseudomonadota bacterium]
FHPGGSLGERLSSKIRDVMFTGDHIPMVFLGSKVEQALGEMDTKGIGATLVVDNKKRLVGIITDGDLRRLLTRKKVIHDLRVEEIMSPAPKTINEDQTAAEALGIMELYEITHLCIVNRENQVKGIVHLHDLFGREGFHLNGGYRLPPGPDH